MIYITMTTVPARTHSTLLRSLRVLNDLNYEDYEIHLNVPEKYSQTGEAYEIPDEIRAMKHVRVFEGLEDLGPKTKIIPTLNRILDDAVIITADDDVIYSRDLIQYHLKKREQHPRSAIGFSGTKDSRLILTPREDTPVDILDNYKTASYEMWMFDEDFFDHYAPQCWNDDIVISAYLRDKGISKIVAAYDQETFFRPRVKSFPLVNLLDCPMTGCDIIRGHPFKSNSAELQKMYEDIRGPK